MSEQPLDDSLILEAPCFLGACQPNTRIGNALDVIVVQGEQAAAMSRFRCDLWKPPTEIPNNDSGTCAFVEINGTESNFDQSLSGTLRSQENVSSSWRRFPLTRHGFLAPLSQQATPLSHMARGSSNGSPKENTTNIYNGNNHDAAALQQFTRYLKPNLNRARIILVHEATASVLVACAHLHVFSWTTHDRIMVVDIDGTITKSNVRGVMDTVWLGLNQYVHDGICACLDKIATNVRFLYLTSRPLGLAHNTRHHFLTQLEQNGCKLPPGALVGFEGTLSQILFMELVAQNVDKFKANALRHHRETLWRGMEHTPFVMGIGNTLMDIQAYFDAGIPLDRIFLIDKQSKIYCLDKPNCAIKERHDFLTARGTLYQGYNDPKLTQYLNDCLSV